MTSTPSLLTVSLLLLIQLQFPSVQSFTLPHSTTTTRPFSTTTPLSIAAEATLAVETLSTVALPATTTSTSLLSQMDAFWQTCPYTAAALVCGVKASAADAIAQHGSTDSSDSDSEESSAAYKHNYPVTTTTTSTTTASTAAALLSSSTDTLNTLLQDLDLKRNLAFLLYGSLYQGITHEYVFNTLYPAWFGTGTELSVVLIKVGFNLLIQTTLVTLPVAYLLKAVIMDQTIPSALHKYWQDIQQQHLLTKCFALWGPVQCLTFSVVPEHYRVTFIAMVSFFWLIILSEISNNENSTESVSVEKK